MNLRDYLHFERISLTKFSRSLELTMTHLSGYLNGRIRVSKKVARAIERITEGKVTAEQVMKDNPPKKKSMLK
jgi:DNA-binding transcriptional regulator YdaS (Cro superfamily)